MPIATNDKGEVLRLDKGQWVPTQTATNPQTKETVALDGGQWVPVAAPQVAARPGFMQRVHDAVIVPPAERDPSLLDAVANGVVGTPAEIVKQVKQGASNLKAHADEAMAEDDPNRIMFDRGNSGVGAMDALGVVMSPITGALTSLVGRPIEQQTGLRREITGAALSMAVPFGGSAKAAGTVEGAAAKATAALKPMALEAHQAGYVLPPKMISDKPGIIANTLAGWSGKVKTAQAASAKNQEVTNALAAKSLGLDPEVGLSPQTFKDIRAKAGKAYDAVKDAIPGIMADEDYLATVRTLGRPGAEAAQRSFPKTTKNQAIIDLQDELSSVREFPTSAGVEIVKELRAQAGANLKAFNDPSKLALGHAQKQAADAVDDLIERNLEKTGNAQLVTDYKAARQQIAKSYDVEAATNPATGNVDARKIAALGAKGKPLTGELDTIAKVAAAFPKAFQSAEKFGEVEPLSILDLGASGAAVAHGNLGVGAAILARPLARGAVLSKPVQNALMNERGATGLSLEELRRAPAVNALYQISNQPQH